MKKSHQHSRPLFQRALEVIQRPFLGPLLFGGVVGGIPLAILFNYLNFRDKPFSEHTLALVLFPVAILVAAVGALLGRSVYGEHLLRRTFFTSLASWIPLPATGYLIVSSRLGYDVFDVHNFPVAVTLLFFLASILTLPSWILALGFAFYKNWRSRGNRDNS